MSGSIGKSLRLSSPLKVEEEAKVIEKQGIVSILGSDCDRTKAASLRRTLSADMSSKKWLAQNGFSPMKKIASSEELAIAVPFSSSSSEGEEEFECKNGLGRPRQADVWRSIQSQKKMENEKPGQLDTWISILSQKANEDSAKLPPPYVHPLVKRSTSSLSEKSLQVCTESLGSETGSDGFSSNAPSETSDLEEEREEPQTQLQQEKELQSCDREELKFVKCTYSTSKKFAAKPFPPPLLSLSRPDGPSLHMEFHRNDGRLVLEAVSVPSQNWFRAQRQDGRLLLTFANSTPEEPNNNEAIIDQEEDEVDEREEEMFENYEEENDYVVEEDGETEEEDDDEEEEEEEMVEKVENGNGDKEIGIVVEKAPKLSSGVINVHRSAIVMKKLMGLDNRNPTWSHKFNKAASLVEMEMEVEEEEEEPTQLPQSLPRPPRVARLIPSPPATASSFNAYEYFWRTKPTVANLINPISHQQCPPLKNKSPNAHEKQEMVLLRGNKADYLVPLVRGCKETRRSLLIWEPYCIASS